MIIKEIQIYGYGKMERVTFSSIGSFHVFYGENEAGKSTIMSFIHSILFGFPLKNQNENRYEPKEHSNYGGKLLVWTETFGDVAIQRMKGKATGDVTVTYSDGRVGNEDDLLELMQGIDKATYQSIFSFDLQGLNGLHKLNENEVSRYLLSAGLLGGDQLFTAEQTIQKEMDSLFKPSGKNPKVNYLLVKSQASFESLSQASKEQNEYEHYLQQYKDLLTEKELIEDQLTKLQDNLSMGHNYLMMEPLLLEEKHLQQKLEQIGEFQFPIEGEKQYQQLKHDLFPIESAVNSLSRKAQLQKEKLNNIQIDEALQEHQEIIQRTIERTASIEPLEHELQSTQHNYEQKTERIFQLKDHINAILPEEEILKLDTSAVTKANVVELVQLHAKLQHDKQTLDDKQEYEQAILKNLDERIKTISSSLLDEAERYRLQKLVEMNNQDQHHTIELKMVEESISSIEKQMQTAKKKEAVNKSNTAKFFTMFIILFVLGAVLSFLFKEWLFAGLFVIGAICTIFMKGFVRASSVVPELFEQLKALKIRREELKKHIKQSVNTDLAHTKTILSRDDEIKQQLQYETIKKEEHEATFYKIVDDFERWERNIVDMNQRSAQLFNMWNLSGEFRSPSILMTIYETIVELKQHIYEKQHLQKRMNELNSQITILKSEMIAYAQTYANVTTTSYQEAVVRMREKLALEEQRKLRKQEVMSEYERIIQELQDVKIEQKRYKKQLQTLLETLHCQDEEEFLHKVQLFKERQNCEEKLALIQLQLAPYNNERTKWEEQQVILNEYMVQSWEQEKDKAEVRLKEVVELLADRKYKIEQLEGGGTYDERLFQHHTQQSELNLEAKEWMKFSLAKNMLQKIVNDYKNQKFPETLKMAEEFMRIITNDEYQHLQWSDIDGSLLLQRKDGMVFESKEVSRGTQEGVYVALRLSLAKLALGNESMPIIIDDSLVNFDYKRVQAVMKVLQSLQTSHQVIFFTCHKHLLPFFSEKDTTILNEAAFNKASKIDTIK